MRKQNIETSSNSKSSKPMSQSGAASFEVVPPAGLPRRSSSRKGPSQANNAMPSTPGAPAKPSPRRQAGAESIEFMFPRWDLTRQSSSRSHRPSYTHDLTAPNGGGHHSVDDQKAHASAEPLADLHAVSDTQTRLAISGERQRSIEVHPGSALANLIDEIREQWKRRQMWHRAEKSLTLQAKAMCRRLLDGDKNEAEKLYKSAQNGMEHDLAQAAQSAMLPLLNGRSVIEASRLAVEKRLLEIGKQLPAAKWVEDTLGFGFGGFVGIIGECGDLSAYANPAKVWKRCGLAVMKDGRQRRVVGDAAIEHGYSPARRSVVWTIGESLLKAQLRRERDDEGNKLDGVKAIGPYGQIYLDRKAYVIAKNERGEYAERAARALAGNSYDKKTEAFKCYSAGRLPPAHIHADAKRYVEKRLLRDLWRAWRDTASSVPLETSHKG